MDIKSGGPKLSCKKKKRKEKSRLSHFEISSFSQHDRHASLALGGDTHDGKF